MNTIDANDIGFIVGIIGLISVLFTVYNYFKNPQIKLDREQALTEKEIGTKATVLAQKELETKALLLAENVKNKNEENDRRFLEMGVRMDRALTLAENHTHTVDVKVDELIKGVGLLTNTITRLETIIEERNPRK